MCAEEHLAVCGGSGHDDAGPTRTKLTLGVEQAGASGQRGLDPNCQGQSVRTQRDFGIRSYFEDFQPPPPIIN